MSYRAADHCFALCAYGESPYLEECIRSLLAQTVPSRVILATATPSPALTALAEKYSLPLHVNTGEAGICGDWNFAYDAAGSPLVTIAHQDDFYEPGYTEAILAAANTARDPIICFTDYYELRDGRPVTDNRLLRVKRLLLAPLRRRALQGSRFVRRRSLSLGCGICCPSVTYVTAKVGPHPFRSGYRSNLDWQLWEKLSRERGAFVYLPQQLMAHRIHAGSATTQVIGADKGRSREDYEMFCRFWPAPAARLLTRLYAGSQDSNTITETKDGTP